MNRHERRKARSREQRLSLKLSEIDSKFDIQVDGKHGSVVMVFANSAGRKVAEDMWPDIEWSLAATQTNGGLRTYGSHDYRRIWRKRCL